MGARCQFWTEKNSKRRSSARHGRLCTAPERNGQAGFCIRSIWQVRFPSMKRQRKSPGAMTNMTDARHSPASPAARAPRRAENPATGRSTLSSSGLSRGSISPRAPEQVSGGWAGRAPSIQQAITAYSMASILVVAAAWSWASEPFWPARKIFQALMMMPARVNSCIRPLLFAFCE